VTGDFYTWQNRAITKGNLAASTTKQMEEQQKMRDGAQLVSADIPETSMQNAASEEAADMAAAQPQAKKSQSARRSQRTSTYRVKSGDTLSKIAQRHGTTVSKLCKLNGIKQNAVLHKGQVLRCS
ncbi:MAG: LysM peptidoglycan-binding domain-containing protein, partial [Bacteroidaceae bacterium]|nr:LysM peptidoglycan-binding domain-containing protein [Bacteroidaceae bacterium]